MVESDKQPTVDYDVEESVVDTGDTAAANLPPEMRALMTARRDPNQVLADFAASAEMVRQLQKSAVALTKPKDWVKMGSGPDAQFYLQESGAGRPAGLLRFMAPPLQEQRITHDDGSFTWVVRGVAASGRLGTVEEIIGARSSNEQFFDKFDEDGNRLPVPDSVVLKAARTNWRNRGIQTLSGLKGLTEEDLKELGLDTSRCRGIEFQKGAKGGGAGGTAPEKFGPEEARGKPWSELSPDHLRFYMKAAEESLADDNKRRFHRTERKRLDQIKAEIHRRREVAKAQADEKKTEGDKDE